MKRLFLLLGAVLLTVPVWADDLKPEPFSQEIKEYNALSTGDIDPGNHEIWKLYICGSLIPNNNYNHEKEIYLTKFYPGTPYIAYIRINQLYNFLQPVPKEGDVIAVEGRVVSHFNSTLEGPNGIKRIPVVYFYVENASKLPFEPDAAAAILGTKLKPTPTAGPTGTPVAAVSSPTPQIAAAPATLAPNSVTPGMAAH